jgi:hypothetical protein
MALETLQIQEKYKQLRTNLEQQVATLKQAGPIDNQTSVLFYTLNEVLSLSIDVCENIDDIELDEDVEPSTKIPLRLITPFISNIEAFLSNGPNVRDWFVNMLIDSGCPAEQANEMWGTLYNVIGLELLVEPYKDMQAWMSGETREEYEARLAATAQAAQQKAAQQPQYPQQPISPPGGTAS